MINIELNRYGTVNERQIVDCLFLFSLDVNLFPEFVATADYESVYDLTFDNIECTCKYCLWTEAVTAFWGWNSSHYVSQLVCRLLSAHMNSQNSSNRKFGIYDIMGVHLPIYCNRTFLQSVTLHTK